MDAMGIRLVGEGVIEITGRAPLSKLLPGVVSGVIVSVVPERWTTQPVWLRIRGPLRLEVSGAPGDRRRLRLDVAALWIGRRRVPAVVLGLVPESVVLRLTRWPVPDTVDAVTVDPGRVTIATR
jgi:hypothetical protein